ncbi:MAG: c-type cytochrome [Bacteroidetes bacterium]|nr:c-type cytochrome [Bacteroidota bacterium]
MKCLRLSEHTRRVCLSFLWLLCAGLGSVYAQDPAAEATSSPAAPAAATLGQSDLLWFLVGLVSLLILVIFILVIATIISIDYFFREKYGYSILPSFRFKLQLSKLWGTQARSARQKMDEELSHDYDGIVELDNAPPPLFNFILYGTIAYAVIYLFVFHVFDLAPLQQAEYAEELRLAEVAKAERMKNMKNFVDENTVIVLEDPASLANGKRIFAENCAACHGQAGEGINGPNLTDKYWIHGGGIRDVFKTVKYGVTDMGMLNWETVLKPSEIAEVSSYILSLQGSNPSNPKEPQGELWAPKDSVAADARPETAAQVK